MKLAKSKRCTKCKSTRRFTQFVKDKRYYDGFKPICKLCGEIDKTDAKEKAMKKWRNSKEGKKHIRNYHLMRFYGISLEERDSICEEQDGKCAICGNKPKPNQRPLHVDHDHQTGEVRGLLCNNCNRGMGMFNDSPDTILKVFKYLKKHNK